MMDSGSGSRRSASITRSAPAGGDRGGRWLTVHRIEVLHSPDEDAIGRAVLVDRQPCALGRAAGGPGSLTVRDPEISSAHAVIVPGVDGHTLMDQGSRNGTFVDGERVRQADLTSGAVIRIGGSLMVFERVHVPEEVDLAPEAPPLLGRSIETRRLRAEIDRIAPQDLTVLVLGETGVGKEVVARALHERSDRVGPFVPVNCGALPAELLEAELFGNVAGAFTSAERARDGLFAAAAGGTILLDEVGEMPLIAQPALLRVLATGEVRPVGGGEPRAVDARVVAATNRDLGQLVAEGAFRADLLSRLGGWRLEVPPLRDRRADILSLTRHFLTSAGAPPALEADVAEALCLHAWPGNVRGLQQAVAAARVRADGGVLSLMHLDPELSRPIRQRRGEDGVGPPRVPLALRVDRDAVPDAEQLELVFRHREGNVARVAEFFGKDRRQIYRWLDRHGLDIDDLR